MRETLPAYLEGVSMCAMSLEDMFNEYSDGTDYDATFGRAEFDRLWLASQDDYNSVANTFRCIAKMFWGSYVDTDFSGELSELDGFFENYWERAPERRGHDMVRRCLEAQGYPLTYLIDPKSPFYRFKKQHAAVGPFHPDTPRQAIWADATNCESVAMESEEYRIWDQIRVQIP